MTMIQLPTFQTSWFLAFTGVRRNNHCLFFGMQANGKSISFLGVDHETFFHGKCNLFDENILHES
jgi:hypothetical protein